ncbi:MAG: hypothetical protein AB2L18_07895 [Anaerolineaceae bacterium]
MPILDDLSKGLKKGMDEAEKGIKEVSEKASDAVKTFEINQEIDKLETEIKGIKVEIGEKALELMAMGTALDPAIEELVKKIEGIKAQIEGKKAKIQEIKND